ncbi:hypothetical protein VTJ83DRAFT_3635 [Remersonia thermophila]|uniref:Uncharacterized protein n=1 Tax=Remersonia thermophila TaxID=72144 RepID=A0ABR4DFH0_9PEZI
MDVPQAALTVLYIAGNAITKQGPAHEGVSYLPPSTLCFGPHHESVQDDVAVLLIIVLLVGIGKCALLFHKLRFMTGVKSLPHSVQGSKKFVIAMGERVGVLVQRIGVHGHGGIFKARNTKGCTDFENAGSADRRSRSREFVCGERTGEWKEKKTWIHQPPNIAQWPGWWCPGSQFVERNVSFRAVIN